MATDGSNARENMGPHSRWAQASERSEQTCGRSVGDSLARPARTEALVLDRLTLVRLIDRVLPRVTSRVLR